MLLASVLAIGAGSFAGCGDTDCPSTASSGAICSTEGLSCFKGEDSCTCQHGAWGCSGMYDLPMAPPRDMQPARDLLSPTD
jgi:hypothetical protein